MSRRTLIGTLSSLLFAGLLILGWPVYAFLAESNAALRNPLGWLQVPSADSCQSNAMSLAPHPGHDQACSLLLTHQRQVKVPSLSAAVAINGKLRWSAAVGWSDLESGVLATPETLYRIGSTSKPVTGTLLARMVDAGLVTLDQPLGEIDNSLPNPDWNQLTLRQLASHTAGLPHYATNRDLHGLYQSMALRRSHTDVRQGLALFDDNAPLFVPGSDFEYSSFGTLLLASVLQTGGQKPFVSLMQDWVLDPLAIESPVPDQPVPERAQFYQLDNGHAQLWRKVDLSNKLPGGGFMSRPEDLVQLGSAWLNPEFISPQTRDQFWTPQVLSDGKVNHQHYALTWRWSEAGGYAHHGGVSKGAMAWLAVYPEQSLVIAIVTNAKLTEFSDFSSVQNQLVKLFRD